MRPFILFKWPRFWQKSTFKIKISISCRGLNIWFEVYSTDSAMAKDFYTYTNK